MHRKMRTSFSGVPIFFKSPILYFIYHFPSTLSVTSFCSLFVFFRLVWALQNVPQLKGALAKDDVLFGSVDTWLLHKFSGGKLHLIDISNAAATGKMSSF